ncbi:MAG: hypothetical protein ABI859_09060 [Pseudomonadota bacterium]
MRRVLLLGLTGLLAVAGSAQAVEFSFTPRFGYYFDNTSQRQSAIDYNSLRDPVFEAEERDFVENTLGGTMETDSIETARNYSQLAFPQYGGTVTFAFDSRPETQFAFTALYGETSGRGQELVNRLTVYDVLGLLIRDTAVTSVRTTNDYSRLDLEGTVQHRLNETFSLLGGIRAERSTIDGSGAYATVQSQHLYNAVLDVLGIVSPPYYDPAEPRSIETYSSTAWTYSARVGAAAYAPVGDKHLFYVNGLVHVSYYDPGLRSFTTSQGQGTGAEKSAIYEAETTVGPDISVGYLYRFSDRFAIDVRYRATVYFTVDGPSDFKDSRVNHGVGVGFTTWLGR